MPRSIWNPRRAKSTPSLAAGHRHVPLDRRRGRRNVKRVALRLAEHQRIKGPLRSGNVAGTQQCPKLDPLIVAEAAVGDACRRHPDPVAAGTEIIAHRRDQAQPNAKLADIEVARWTSGSGQ